MSPSGRDGRLALGAVAAVGLGFALLALFGVRDDVLQARIAGVGLGIVVAMLGLFRPSGYWDSPRVQVWRDLVGDRGVQAFYVLVGLAIAIGLATFTPTRPS